MAPIHHRMPVILEPEDWPSLVQQPAEFWLRYREIKLRFSQRTGWVACLIDLNDLQDKSDKKKQSEQHANQ